MARLLSSIVNGLAKRNHNLYVAANFTRPVNYIIDDRIKRIAWYPNNYYQTNKLKRLIYLIKEARRIIKKEKPDVIVSACPHTILLSRISGIGLNIPYIFADNTSFTRKDIPFIHFIRYHFYNFADRVTIQTENDKKVLGKRLPHKVVISNPLSYPIFKGSSQREKSILAIGHTDRWEVKGFDLLFKIWGQLYPSFPDWRLKIIGGESAASKELLLKMINDNGIANSVEFLGFRNDIDSIMQNCSVFVLTSRIEGFSISLTEALSQGLPAVSFRINGVITDVTDDGHGTLLVDDGDLEGFVKSLRELMSNNDLWAAKSEEGLSFVKKYDVDNIVNIWDGLLYEVAKNR